MYGVELAGLLEDPTFSVGMIGWFARGAMDLTYLVQNLFMLDSSSLAPLEGGFCLGRELLNPAFTVVHFVLYPLY